MWDSFTIILTLIIILVFLIILTVFAVLIYSGIFNQIDDVGTGKPPVGKLIIAYKFQRGPYSEAGQIFTEAAIVAPKNKALGIYYDDPKKVGSLFLRYVVGSILAEGDAPIDENMVKQFTERGFKILNLPEVAFAVQTRFPHTTSLSILIGINKAYPRLEEYISEHKLCAHPCMEYYDGINIHFFAPLSKQNDFYVPECSVNSPEEEADRTQSQIDSCSESEILEESQTSDHISNIDIDMNASLDSNCASPKEISSCFATQDTQEIGLKRDDISSDKEEIQKDNGSNNDEASDDSTSSFEFVKKEKNV